MLTVKSYGQIAFEAYGKNFDSAATLPWEELHQQTRDAWLAAAQAVAEKLGSAEAQCAQGALTHGLLSRCFQNFSE
jgi:hypothetical protein